MSLERLHIDCSVHRREPWLMEMSSERELVSDLEGFEDRGNESELGFTAGSRDGWRDLICVPGQSLWKHFEQWIVNEKKTSKEVCLITQTSEDKSLNWDMEKVNGKISQ